MKKSIAATLTIGTLAISALVAACGRQAPAMLAAKATTPEAGVGKVAAPVAPVVPAVATTDEERLTAMQSSIGMLINDYMVRSTIVPDYLFNVSDRIAQTREALRQLDGQRDGLSMLVARYAAMGTAPPEYVFDAIDRVEQARSEALNAVGLDH